MSDTEVPIFGVEISVSTVFDEAEFRAALPASLRSTLSFPAALFGLLDRPTGRMQSVQLGPACQREIRPATLISCLIGLCAKSSQFCHDFFPRALRRLVREGGTDNGHAAPISVLPASAKRTITTCAVAVRGQRTEGRGLACGAGGRKNAGRGLRRRGGLRWYARKSSCTLENFRGPRPPSSSYSL